MKKKITFILFACCILLVGLIASSKFGRDTATAATTYVTTITVNSTKDLDNSGSKTCAAYPSEACTLRRAIVQARGLGASARPVLIEFNIPTSDSGYDSILKVWKFDEFLISTIASKTIFREITGGMVTIDGSTQPGGRTSGPKIILVGPGDGSKYGLNLSSGSGNVIRGIAFQNWEDSISMTSTDSVIENCWFGLDDAGELQAWRDEDEYSKGTGANGVVLYAGASGNAIQNNVFLGLNGTAATIRDDDNLFADNKVGTNKNGLTPGKTTDPNLICTEWDWYGGSGIRLEGDDHIVEDNIFTGVRLDLSATSTQPEAIYVGESCDRVIIRNNRIGLDSADKVKGVCGRGINVFNSKKSEITGNSLANTHSSAIFLNGSLYRDNEISKNLIRKSTPWAWPVGAKKADNAILRSDGLPDAFEFFNPARITSINKTTVKGTSGLNSPCPNCLVEIFLDDKDGVTEALKYLGSATANTSGNWTFTLPSPLTSSQGLRTTSTTKTPNIITGFGPNTTVGLSELYVSSTKIYLPLIVR